MGNCEYICEAKQGAELSNAQCQITSNPCGSSTGQERLEGSAESPDVQGKASGQRVGGMGKWAPGSPNLFLGQGFWPAEGGLPQGFLPHQSLRSPAAASAYHPALWTGKMPRLHPHAWNYRQVLRPSSISIETTCLPPVPQYLLPASPSPSFTQLP